MTTKLTVTIVLILIAASALAGLLLWDRLPDPMASHWNANDQVDGYMSKAWSLSMIPLIALAMLALFMIIPSIDPLKANIEKFRETFNLFATMIITFVFYVYGLTIVWSLGYQNFKMSSALLPFIGILFIFIGYMLRKAKRNFFIGIRTPWTLSSDTVWDKTHQLGSVLFMISGVFAFIGAFLGGMSAFLLMLMPLLASTLFLVVYSFMLYRDETRS